MENKKSELEGLTDPVGLFGPKQRPSDPGAIWQILGVVGILASFISLAYGVSDAAFVIGFAASLGLIAVGSIINAINVCAERLIPRSPCHVCHKPFPTADLHCLDSGQLICPECRSEMKT